MLWRRAIDDALWGCGSELAFEARALALSLDEKVQFGAVRDFQKSHSSGRNPGSVTKRPRELGLAQSTGNRRARLQATARGNRCAWQGAW